MKPFRDVTISADDMEFVYQAVLQYGQDLLKYSSWLKSKEGKPLPGMDVATAEVDKEVERYRALAIELYKQCYTTKPADGGPEAFVPGFCGMPGCSDCEKHKTALGVAGRFGDADLVPGNAGGTVAVMPTGVKGAPTPQAHDGCLCVKCEAIRKATLTPGVAVPSKLDRLLSMVRVWVEKEGGDADALLAFMHAPGVAASDHQT